MKAREAVRRLAERFIGERAAPVGGVARDRRLVRRTLAGEPVGRVLVVGPGLAVRQALPGAVVDVAGTSPHSEEVTVCSPALDAGSLPPLRWDTVIVTDPGPDLSRRLAAVRPACRPGGRLVLVSAADDAVPVGFDVRVAMRHGGRGSWVTAP